MSVGYMASRLGLGSWPLNYPVNNVPVGVSGTLLCYY